MNQLVQGFAAARDSVFAIDAAWLKLSELRRIHAESQALVQQCADQITDHPKLSEPAPDEKIDALRQWLERLELRSADGQYTAVAVGLQNWNKAVETCVNNEREASAKNRAMLDTRNELRGRLEALKAKARAYGINEGPELVGIAREAANCLQAKPLPLGRAASLLQAYETRLRTEMKK
jgi:DNA repair ATPase RecN